MPACIIDAGSTVSLLPSLVGLRSPRRVADVLAVAFVVAMASAWPAAVRAQEPPLAITPFLDGQDAQLWMQFNTRVPVSSWALIFEGQPRWNQNLTHFDQILVRAGVSRRVTRALELSAAYAFIPRHTVLGVFYEHQTYEQALVGLPRLGQWTPQLRLRQEQRRLAEWGDTSHRTRAQIRLARPLPRRTDWSVVLYEETLATLDDTRHGPSHGLDQVRFYSGLQHPVTKDLTVEVGYMWQEVLKLGLRPHMRVHNAMVQVQYRPRRAGARAPGVPLSVATPSLPTD